MRLDRAGLPSTVASVAKHPPPCRSILRRNDADHIEIGMQASGAKKPQRRQQTRPLHGYGRA
jgi:hypothetical protein